MPYGLVCLSNTAVGDARGRCQWSAVAREGTSYYVFIIKNESMGMHNAYGLVCLSNTAVGDARGRCQWSAVARRYILCFHNQKQKYGDA